MSTFAACDRCVPSPPSSGLCTFGTSRIPASHPKRRKQRPHPKGRTRSTVFFNAHPQPGRGFPSRPWGTHAESCLASASAPSRTDRELHTLSHGFVRRDSLDVRRVLPAGAGNADGDERQDISVWHSLHNVVDSTRQERIPELKVRTCHPVVRYQHLANAAFVIMIDSRGQRSPNRFRAGGTGAGSPARLHPQCGSTNRVARKYCLALYHRCIKPGDPNV
jgi:hypothetical protein